MLRSYWLLFIPSSDIYKLFPIAQYSPTVIIVTGFPAALRNHLPGGRANGRLIRQQAKDTLIMSNIPFAKRVPRNSNSNGSECWEGQTLPLTDSFDIGTHGIGPMMNREGSGGLK